MARSPNCTGAPLYKGRVDVSITYPDPYEPPLLDPPEALPTSEPASPQIEITITSAMLPTWSPFELPHTLTALLYSAGKNTSASSATVYYRIIKNGSSVATGSGAVGASYYWTLSAFNLLGVNAGDTIELSLWANRDGVNYDLKALVVIPTRIGPSDAPVSSVRIAFDFYYALTVGNPSPSQNVTIRLTHDDAFDAFANTSPALLRLVWSGPTYRVARVFTGDYSQTVNIMTNANYRPIYARSPVVGSISYTPLNLRV